MFDYQNNSNIYLGQVSTHIDCGDDFYNHVNYDWLNSVQIPNDENRWSVFNILKENTDFNIKKLIEALYQTNDTNYKKLFIVYSQGINRVINSDPKSLYLIQLFIDKIKSSQSCFDLFNLVMDFHLDFDLTLPFSIIIQSNLKNSDEVILHISSGGLGLPDREYYLTQNSRNDFIQKKYLEFIKSYSNLFNLYIDSNKLFNLEKKLAEQTYTRVQKRNPDLLDNLTNWEQFIKSHHNFLFMNKIFERANKKPSKINITNPKYMDFINQLIETESLDNWKNYFLFKIILEFNSYLSETIEKTFFDFYHGIISGTKKMKPIWKRSLNVLDNYMGELVGKLYVDNYFKNESKEKANELFIYIKNELDHYLRTNDWMESQTKIKAIEKLNKMNIKIGYPENLELDWDRVKISESNSYLENILNLRKFNYDWVLKKLYEKLNRNSWAMPAHVINAYYSPTLNEIVFPAGILQKPFFSVDQEPALNFGGIGMVIGHEITHGFDDQGSKYDSNGNLNNWWTPSDYQKYKDKTNNIKEQYNKYEIEGNKVNGQLTLGENIADIGGLGLSYKAFTKYINDYHTKSKTDSKYQKIFKFDTHSPKQKFFLNYANIWKMKSTKEDTINRLIIDPHAPPVFRVNGVVRNLDTFYDAFNINPSNQLYLKPELRAKIWSE